jgi:hypothetical protein
MNIAQALEIIESGKVFSLLYVPFDKKKKSGGGKKFRDELMITVPKQERDPIKAKNFVPQNHKANATRNLYKCIGGEPTAAIVTIHIFLILEVNGEKVML